ncbi:hypothetical protein [Nostoc sp.]
MKLNTFINCAFVIASIALVPGIAIAQTANNDSGNPLAVNSNNLPTQFKNNSVLQPFQTAFFAYQGYFKPEGIPSAGALIFQYKGGEITAVDVVKAAIKANRLPAQTLNDTDYINAVDSQLRSFSRD